MDEKFVFCGTNIFKQFSDWLSGYDGLMSAVELFVEGLFLLLVLKEFKMTRKSFEWTENDRRDKEIRRKVSFILSKIVDNFINNFYYLSFVIGENNIEDNQITKNIPMDLKRYIYVQLLSIIRKTKKDMQIDLDNKKSNIEMDYNNNRVQDFNSAFNFSRRFGQEEQEKRQKQQFIERELTNKYHRFACEKLERVKTDYQMGAIPDEIYDTVRSFLNNEQVNKLYEKLTNIKL